MTAFMCLPVSLMVVGDDGDRTVNNRKIAVEKEQAGTICLS